MASPLAEKLLQYLSHTESVDSRIVAKEFEVDHQKIVGAVKSLQSLGNVISAEQQTEHKTELTPEGKLIAEKGSHEAIVFAAVSSEGTSHNDLAKAAGQSVKIGLNKAMQNKWIAVVKSGNTKTYNRLVDSIYDEVHEDLKMLSSGAKQLPKQKMDEYKKRKLLTFISTTFYMIRRGENFTTTIEKPETDLTSDMLSTGSWRTLNFKPYNFDAMGIPINRGHLHPLLKVRSEFRTILTEMGFSEMPTNRFVESSFWNFDALFVPQKHPARDAQDTFFVSRPSVCNSVPEDYRDRVQKVHSVGDYGSQGYNSEWKIEESVKNVMRTHTTAVSARLLYQLGQAKEFVPSKLFSIDRVFRNETLDATHLAEFHQVEGVVADRGINLGHLIGIMKEFFSRLGINKLRFKPAYNPYTEPSMEVFAFHEGLKKWVEVGNSGMFRPEMVLPMGIPEDVRIIAWGLSLERPTMIKYGIDNIRDLVGPKVDLQMVYNNPICRLDKV